MSYSMQIAMVLVGMLLGFGIVATVCTVIGLYLDRCANRAKVARRNAGLDDEFDNF